MVVLKERWRSIQVVLALKMGWWPKTGVVVLKKGDGGEKKGSDRQSTHSLSK